MMTGLPIVALATTEMATVIRSGVSGFADTDPRKLVAGMQHLLADRAAARALGEAARRQALERFGIARFVSDWEDALAAITG
jgi:glycosyltransferase involved in cell wall biosynthesis